MQTATSATLCSPPSHPLDCPRVGYIADMATELRGNTDVPCYCAALCLPQTSPPGVQDGDSHAILDSPVPSPPFLRLLLALLLTPCKMPVISSILPSVPPLLLRSTPPACRATPLLPQTTPQTAPLHRAASPLGMPKIHLPGFQK